ncbi:multicomponent Na+:H+ antiporter subunit F [Rhizobium sp. RU20A]|uniref:cation:proton antiporter n=1 Tax=Rhizobium sp. RU20A TaxID=1907412 RepID=UPI0009555A60|nr:cation:proton antiporter [Rhizobium sp. RU20A]SIR16644.1 multicomponent Na+:H+ antiporter subunit F [Rhizobium sp. RU20A]
MTPAALIDMATSAALVILSIALLLTVVRIVRGPTLADRVLGLDMLVAVAIGMIAVIALRSGFTLYIDIAIALGLVGFLATIAFARFILARGLNPEAEGGRGAVAAVARKPAVSGAKAGKKAQGKGRKGKG